MGGLAKALALACLLAALPGAQALGEEAQQELAEEEPSCTSVEVASSQETSVSSSTSPARVTASGGGFSVSVVVKSPSQCAGDDPGQKSAEKVVRAVHGLLGDVNDLRDDVPLP